jgi:hypothetical protein
MIKHTRLTAALTRIGSSSNKGSISIRLARDEIADAITSMDILQKEFPSKISELKAVRDCMDRAFDILDQLEENGETP